MKLKTSPVFAIEGATQESNSSDLKLLGSEYVANLGSDWSISVKNGEFKSENHSFFVVYGLDCKFFYIAKIYDPKKVRSYEVGLGYLYEKDGNFFLNRFRPLYFSEGEELPSPVYFKPRPLITSSPELLIVSTYVPQSYIEVLTDDNSIITSVAPHVPSSVVVNKDSLVGRLGDNIESINIKDLCKNPVFSQTVVDSLKDYTKQLLLKSSKITAKQINVDYLSLNLTNSKPPEKDGHIYFDKESGTIRYYYDNNWNIILSKEI